MRGLWLTSVLLLACGRIGFEPTDSSTTTATDGTAIGDGAALDQSLACAPIPCGGTARFVMCGSRCFASCQDTSNQTAGKATCATWGGALLSIHDATEQACADMLAQNLAIGLWLGYEQTPQSDTMAFTLGWTWNDSSPSGAYTHWLSTEPNDAGDGLEDGEEQCSNLLGGGRWNDELCGEQRGVACAR